MKHIAMDHSIPKHEQGFPFIATVEALLPNDTPLKGVIPGVDSNLAKVTEDFLFMRNAEGRVYSGRNSLSWWATIFIVFCFVLYLLAEIYGFYKNIMEKGTIDTTGMLPMYLLVYVFFPAAFSWMYIPWRKQTPVIFDRVRRKVACCIKGKVYIGDYNNIKAYIKNITSVAYGGMTNEGMVMITFLTKVKGEEISVRVPIYGSHDHPHAFGQEHKTIYAAAMVWEYIQCFMRKGVAGLPEDQRELAPGDYCFNSVAEICHTYSLIEWAKNLFNSYCPVNTNTYPSLKKYDKSPIWLLILIPWRVCVMLPFYPILFPGELIYYALDKILPRKKWPAELLEFCNHVWDGKE